MQDTRVHKAHDRPAFEALEPRLLLSADYVNLETPLEDITAGNSSGTTVRVCYDEDTIASNGNKHWLAIDTPVSGATESLAWAAAMLPAEARSIVG